MRRRIQRDTRHEDFIKSLMNCEYPVFTEIWRILLFAAAYGVMKKQRTALVKVDSNKSMPADYFSSPGWMGFLYLIGFAETESTDHLKNDEDQHDILVTAFEEYANFGLIEISKRVISPENALDCFIEMLLERPTDALPEPNVNDLLL